MIGSMLPDMNVGAKWLEYMNEINVAFDARSISGRYSEYNGSRTYEAPDRRNKMERVRIENPAVIGFPPVSVRTRSCPAAIAGYAHPYHSHYDGVVLSRIYGSPQLRLSTTWNYRQNSNLAIGDNLGLGKSLITS